MQQAAGHGEADTTVSGVPWERVVRQIPLAARGDVLDDMAGIWNSYVHNLEAFHDRFNRIWDDYLDGRWTGDAADACHAAWRKSAGNILKISNNYADMPGLLRHCSASIHEAISNIPIPLFGATLGGGELPGQSGSGTSGGGELYQDYQSNRPAYADYEFLRRAKLADDTHHTNGVRVGGSSGYRQDDVTLSERSGLEDAQRARRDAAIDAWYALHQGTAHNAREQLLNQYAHTHSNMPGATPEMKMDHGADTGPSTSGSAGGSAGSYGGDVGGGVGPSVGGMPPTSTYGGGSSVAMPDARAPHEVLGPPQVGHPGDYSTDPGSGLAGSSDLYSPDHRPGLPTSSIGAYSPGGGGGAALGSGSGGWAGGGVGVPATTSAPQQGWWNSRPGSAPMGPRVSPPGSLESTPGATAKPGGPGSGMGMMPHGSGAGKSGDNEEYQTWLTEDDDDIWGTRRNDITTGWIE